MENCSKCGQSVPHEVSLPTHAQALEDACRNAGHFVTIDGRVSEQVAAELLGRAAGTLANWAYADAPLRFVKVRGRRTYRLADIAEMLAYTGE